MTLQEFINEAISSGKYRKLGFPFKNGTIPDKETLVNWLEANGYKEVDTNHRSIIYELDKSDYDRVSKMTRNKKTKIYTTGQYAGAPTHWVSFGNEDCMITIRTSDMSNAVTHFSYEQLFARIYDPKNEKYDEVLLTDIDDVVATIDRYLNI
jgi:hypothetical protein